LTEHDNTKNDCDFDYHCHLTKEMFANDKKIISVFKKQIIQQRKQFSKNNNTTTKTRGNRRTSKVAGIARRVAIVGLSQQPNATEAH